MSGIRFHTKSKSGCTTCKHRRVKCDEGKPQCANCLRRMAECVYVVAKRKSRSSTAEPNPPIIEHTSGPQSEMGCSGDGDIGGGDGGGRQSPTEAHYDANHLLDLRLMHHYTAYAAEALAGAGSPIGAGHLASKLKFDLPQAASQHQFLMDAILYVAMVHLGSSNPTSIDSLPIYIYRDRALRSLRRVVPDTSPETIRATRAATFLLAGVSFPASRITKQTDLWITDWMTLALGQRNFSAFQRYPSLLHVENDSQSPSSTPSAMIPIDILEAITNSDNDRGLDVIYSAAAELGKIILMLDIAYEQSTLENKIKSWSFSTVPPEFLEMIRQRRPCVLVVLAYYLVLFRFLPDSWIYQDLVSHDIKEIQTAVGPRWEEYLSIPLTATQVVEKTTLARLLLNCLQNYE
ncbi:hypothetical protein F5Y04DRAFT_251272 [Hypomontagnella monticulosa]|nr:hypothetical protein F5Y04DRAFT_251272 [Hypomontagnella monticulosa]